MEIEETLNERRETHGDFGSVAKLNIMLKECFRTHSTNTWEVDYIEDQMVALNMIFHKLSRIGCGKIDEIDHWRDIAGYATLVVKELEKQRELEENNI
ncbi:DUF6378 domain-containing protein [Campylobacter vicugnae]|uniref:DUF6378 domain-containing protein n=1 Tax=Campylobacter vicugnae TaxID=1660076 RepID=A0ABZ2E6I2_9BACT|nr:MULTISPECIES: DUF6378 domain-containing protein [unclassified Campylobacter]